LIPPAVALLTDDVGWGVELVDRIATAADAWTRAMLQLLRAFLQGNAGNLATTRETLTAAVDGFRASGDRWGLAIAYTALAEAQAILGDHAGAAEGLTEAIRFLRELDPQDDAVLQRTSLATARIALGDTDRARSELAELVSPETGPPSGRFLVFARIQLGNLARYGGDRAQAAHLYAAARTDLGTAVTSAPLAKALLDTAEAHLALDQGDVVPAQGLLAGAFKVAAGVPDMPITAVVAVGVARWLAAVAAAGTAAPVLGAAHVLRGAPDAANPDVIRTAAVIRERMGEAAYLRAYGQATRLSRSAALDLVASQLHGESQAEARVPAQTMTTATCTRNDSVAAEDGDHGVRIPGRGPG
jgi:hypothetical protein